MMSIPPKSEGPGEAGVPSGERRGAGPSSKGRESIRLGAISFVNTIPIYSDYHPEPHVELVYDVPARLNEKMLAGELDISPVSSACYLRNKDKLALLDDLSVSSPGAVESVIFVSSKPLGPELLDVPLISVPNDSETSIALLAYLLKEATGKALSSWFRTYEACRYRETLHETGNALIIGDNALLIQQEGMPDNWHCYDLSTLWKERTGLPFVFAVWVATQRWAGENADALGKINAGLCEARNRFYASPSIFQAGLDAAKQRSALPEEVLARYYTQCLNYNLDGEHRASLALFDTMIQASEDPASRPYERQSV